MYWRLRMDADAAEASAEEVRATDGRFVLHRHRDALGPHLDLRIAWGDALMGWRIDDTVLRDDAWATEKAPHPLRWLDAPGDAVTEDAGRYAWIERGADCKAFRLRGTSGARVVRFERASGLPAAVVRDLRRALDELGADVGDAARLLRDGRRARQRLMARFCGLARELDGEAFDEAVWRRALDGMTLDELQEQTRTLEVRHDRSHPPMPVSRPEPLPEWRGDGREERAMRIARER